MRLPVLLASLMIFILLTAGCIQHPTPPAPTNDSDRITVETFDNLNDIRRYAGLPILRWDGVLADNAAFRSCDLIYNFAHQDMYALWNNPDYASFTLLSENITRIGWWHDLSQMHGKFVNEMFWASPSHRAAMLDGRYDRVGIWTCIFSTNTPGLWTVFVVQEFGG
jgi:uncharacterized protein YkwD